MTKTTVPAVVTIVAEGTTDAAVLQRILSYLSLSAGPIHITGGKSKLDKHLAGYNQAARFGPWLVLRDLDLDRDCAPTLIAELLPQPAPDMHLRVAVQATEAWLLADRERMADFLRINVGKVPRAPETIANPKQCLVDLANRSRSAAIRRAFVPEPGSSARVGTAYTAMIIEFASLRWQPEVAAKRSGSLLRCLRALATWRDSRR